MKGEKMSRIIFYRITIIIGLLIILSTVGCLYLKQQIKIAQRHHLLCEILEPGMSRDDVLNILLQEGAFTANEVDWPSAFFSLDISFTDPKLLDRYGHFSVVFIDYGYARAVIPRGSGPPEYICDFYQATRSIIYTP
jgi:hypothetical protein